MNRVLRPFVPSRKPAFFAPDQLTELIEQAPLLNGCASSSELVGESELGEFAHRDGLQIDADPQRDKVAHGLVYAHRNAGLMQAQGHREPRDAASDDDHLHRCARSLLLQTASGVPSHACGYRACIATLRWRAVTARRPEGS